MTSAAADLTEARSQFWSEGACLVRAALPPADLEAARSAVADLDGTGDLADLSALASSEEGPRFRAGLDHWRTSNAFLELATTGILPAIAAAVLDTPRLWLYEDSVLVKEPGSTVATRWHTDDGYFHVEGRQLATMWVALDPAPRAAGSLRFLRGSHLRPSRYRPTLFVIDEPLPGTEGEVPPQPDHDDPDVFGFDLDAGDLTIHHSAALHAAGGNATATPRRALSIRYCGEDAVVRVKPGAPPKAGFDEVAPGTPLAEAAGPLGLHEASTAR
jgi:ectoine hydroxylase-related dioxygenase (phytanoyl-CoA dioxygenase family)